jgi:hypothetical protein
VPQNWYELLADPRFSGEKADPRFYFGVYWISNYLETSFLFDITIFVKTTIDLFLSFSQQIEGDQLS